MSGQNPSVSGASAPKEPCDPILQDAVAGLIRLSLEDRDHLNSYTIETCEEKLQELVSYVNDPTGKPQRTIPEVLGQIALLYQRKAELQAKESQERLAQLQHDYSRLQQEAQAREDEPSYAHSRASGRESASQGSASDQGARVPASSGEASEGESEPPPETTAARQTELELQAALKREAELLSKLESVQSGVQPTSRYRGPEADPPVRYGVRNQPQVGGSGQSGPPPSRFWGLSAPPPEGRPSHITLRSDNAHTPPQREYSHLQAHYGVDNYGLPSSGGAYPRRHPRAYHHEDITSDDSDGPCPPREQGLRTRQLESLAKDIERFDPSNKESSIDDYLREVERCLLDLPNPSSREKLKLIWKTTPRSVHIFMETLPPATRDRYSALCQALREEYSPYNDPASATLGAFNIIHKRSEPPREYFRRLRVAYFQGRNAPGLEEEHQFKCLFVNNLHESVRFEVALFCRSGNYPMQEIRKHAQTVWELRNRPGRRAEVDARVLGIQASETADLALEGKELPRVKTSAQSASHSQHPARKQSGRQGQGGEKFKPRNFPRQKRETEKGSKQGGKFNQKQQSHQRGDALKSDMRDWIQTCVAEAVGKLDLSRQHTPSKGQDPKPPPV